MKNLIDDERIYSYLALRFARNDKTELPGFEQDDYARHLKQRFQFALERIKVRVAS